MATIEELEDRIRKMENILTLFSRDIFEQFDLKIKAAETSLIREIEAKIDIKEIEAKIDRMFERIGNEYKEYKTNKTIELKEGINTIYLDLKDLEMRILHIEAYLKKQRK